MDWKQLTSDFKQKFEGCWCFVTLEGSLHPELFKLKDVEMQSEGAPLLFFENSQVGEILLKYNLSKSNIEFSLPKTGLYQCNNKVLVVRKGHARQWKSGLSEGVMLVNDLYDRLFNRLSTRVWEEDRVKAVFAPQPTITLTEASNQLKEKAAVRLSNEFALGHNISSDQSLLLFYMENPVGTYSPSSNKVLLKEVQFEQELQDFIRETNSVATYETYRGAV